MKTMFIVTVRYANTGQKCGQYNCTAFTKGEAMLKSLELAAADEAKRTSLTFNQVYGRIPMTASARVFRSSK